MFALVEAAIAPQPGQMASLRSSAPHLADQIATPAYRQREYGLGHLTRRHFPVLERRPQSGAETGLALWPDGAFGFTCEPYQVEEGGCRESWPGVDDAEGSEGIACSIKKRHSGVETHVGRAHHESILRKSPVMCCVDRYDGLTRMFDCMETKSILARHLRESGTHACRKQFSSAIDDRDQGYGNVIIAGGRFYYVLKSGVFGALGDPRSINCFLPPLLKQGR